MPTPAIVRSALSAVALSAIAGSLLLMAPAPAEAETGTPDCAVRAAEGTTPAAGAAEAGCDSIVEDPVREPRRASRAPSTEALAAPLEDTFSLESLPGAEKTIWLHFGGVTLTGTQWNSAYGVPTITSLPYSTDGDPAFSASELARVQAVWESTAAYFAPFGVNVVTGDPGADALDRATAADTRFGIRVEVTPRNQLSDICGCGGLALINVFERIGASRPASAVAWVFTDELRVDTKSIADTAAHEIGHVFGLSHDGDAHDEYHWGDEPWAPVMGFSNWEPVAHWSKGEYPGATNSEDDIAILARQLGFAADDHGDTAATATMIEKGVAVPGLISTRDDVDAFRFVASGATTLSATIERWSMTDLQLTILDESGGVVAVVDPEVQAVRHDWAEGRSATWTADLPASGGLFTALVEGVGSGDPSIPGKYSDYSSLGRYTVTLDTEYDSTLDLPVIDPAVGATLLASVGASALVILVLRGRMRRAS